MHHGFIGFGNMAKAIFNGLKEDSKNKFLYISKTNTHKEATVAENFKDLVNTSEVLWLCIKPQVLDEVLDELKNFDLSEKTIVSVIAGKTISHIQNKLQHENKTTIIRTMPNLAIAYKKSVTAFCANTKSITTNEVKESLKQVGEVVEIDESHFDIFTAIFGSGPAFILETMKAFRKQITKLDTNEETTNNLLYKLFEGSITHFNKNKDDQKITKMIANITSKGGTTEAGLNIYKEQKIEENLENVMIAAAERSKNMR